ncbi:MAG: aminotransferase class V-fold PLP-dependent enzyme [Proteobacteria bacterium]|nr:aminotransferase class V-fold PLP-dependent enzyme [Pseudomonadota bacterium]NBP14461.1 aminotransferase class V-fold PLP-dependent enzyme [bacterium]
MIRTVIDSLATNAKPGYMKNYDNFQPGKDTVLYSGPYWDKLELTAAIDALVNGAWITTGEKVAEFQDQFSKMFSVNYSHMVNSGSSANLVMFTALKKHLGWNDGDELIVSPVGFPTTIAPIAQNNLKPVFVDIELETLNFDIDLIEKAITKKTKAIVVSPVLGNPPDMDKIKNLCSKYNIKLIGDNCDSLGTNWKGNHITKYYYAWSCSFYPAHHITTGEGGMISSDDESYMNTVRSISWWGRDCYCVGNNNTLSCGTCGKRFDYWLNDYDGIVDHKYVFSNMGYNLKPLDLQGAIGLVQLTKMGEIDFKRRRHKEIIGNALESNIEGVRVAKTLLGADPSWFGVPIICDSQELKEMLVAHFESNKVQTRSYFAGNILLHPGYKHLGNYKDFPNSNLALSHVFFLGCTPLFNDAVLDYITEVIKKW